MKFLFLSFGKRGSPSPRGQYENRGFRKIISFSRPTLSPDQFSFFFSPFPFGVSILPPPPLKTGEVMLAFPRKLESKLGCFPVMGVGGGGEGEGEGEGKVPEVRRY